MPALRTRVYENFRDYLAARFSNAAAIRTFVGEPSIGIAEADFPITGTARSVWQAVLSLALADGKYEAIVEQAVAEGPAAEEPAIREYATIWMTHPEPVTPTVDLTNPYPGLTPFEEKDHAYFFGRERWVRAILDELEDHSFHSLYGGSGSGKSSLLRAGVIPQWKKKTGGRAVLFTPGPDPFQSLLSMGLQNSAVAESLIKEAANGSRVDLFSALQSKVRGSTPLLLVMDQGEQLFTRTTDVPLRQKFLNCLHVEQDGAVKIVVGIRDDYWAEWNKTLPTRLSSYKLLQPPTESERLDIVILPARKHRVFFGTGVASRILESLDSDRFALPLLQFFLKELWDTRPPEEGMLELEDYKSFGGVEAKLQEHIESFLTAFASRESDIHKILLSLVRFDEREGRFLAFARSAPRQTLPEDLVDAMLSDQWRLLTTSPEPGHVEFAHEIIITLWPDFEEFKNQHGVILSVHSDLREDTPIWSRAKTKGDKTRTLWSGIRLDRALQYAGLGPYVGKVDQFTLAGSSLTQAERDFLLAGMEQQKQARKNRTILMATIMAFMLSALVLALLTYLSRSKLAERTVELESANKKINGVLAESSWQIGQEYRGAPYATPQSSAILATHRLLRSAVSWEKAKDGAACYGSLAAARITSADLCSSVHFPGVPIKFIQTSDTPELACYNHSGAIDFFQPLENKIRKSIKLPFRSSSHVVSNNGLRMVHNKDYTISDSTTENAGGLHLTDLTTGDSICVLQSFFDMLTPPIFSEDCNFLLVANWDNASLWDANKGIKLAVLQNSGLVQRAVWGQNPSRIITWAIDSEAQPLPPKLWDTNGNQLSLGVSTTNSPVKGATFDYQGQQIASWTSQDGFIISSVHAAKPLSNMVVAQGSELDGANFSPKGDRAIFWTTNGEIHLCRRTKGDDIEGQWDVMTMNHPKTHGAIFTEDANTILTWGSDGTLKCWRGNLKTPAWEQQTDDQQSIDEAKLDKSGNFVFTRNSSGKVAIFDLEFGEEIATSVEGISSLGESRFLELGKPFISLTKGSEFARIWKPDNLLRKLSYDSSETLLWQPPKDMAPFRRKDRDNTETLEPTNEPDTDINFRADTWLSPNKEFALCTKNGYSFSLLKRLTFSHLPGYVERGWPPSYNDMGRYLTVPKVKRYLGHRVSLEWKSPPVAVTGFSPDGKMVIISSLHLVSLWSTSTSELIGTFSMYPCKQAGFGVDGKSILFFYGGYEPKILDLHSVSDMPASWHQIEFEVRSATALGYDGVLRNLGYEEWAAKREELEAWQNGKPD